MARSPLRAPLKNGRSFLVRIPQGADFYEWLTAFCLERKIACATLSVIGATTKATIGYYDQVRHEYEKTTFTEELEIVSCCGNASLKDGKPFLHLHAVLSDAKLRCHGGHVFPGSAVFAAEAHIQELVGGRRERLPDPPTGLSLWCPGSDA